jgi:putative lipoprotein
VTRSRTLGGVVAAATFVCVTAACSTGDDAATSPTAASTAASDPLDGTGWQLEAVEDLAIPADAVMTAAFANPSVAGSGGCNRYSGTYAVDGDALTIDVAASTTATCAPAIDAAEQVYLAALEDVEAFGLPDSGRLELTTSRGARLTFTTQPSG